MRARKRTGSPDLSAAVKLWDAASLVCLWQRLPIERASIRWRSSTTANAWSSPPALIPWRSGRGRWSNRRFAAIILCWPWLFHLDGRVLAAEGQNHSIELMDIATGVIRQTLKGHTGQTAKRWRSSRTTTCSPSAAFARWIAAFVEIERATAIRRKASRPIPGGVGCIAFSADGGLLTISGGGGDRVVRVVESAHGRTGQNLDGTPVQAY